MLFHSFYGQHQNGYTIIIVVNEHTNTQTKTNKVYYSKSVFVGINVVYPKINHPPQKKNIGTPVWLLLPSPMTWLEHFNHVDVIVRDLLQVAGTLKPT